MKINYTVKKMTLKPSTKEHIEKKLHKLDKFFDDDAAANIMLRLENNRVTAELTIRNGSMVYRAENTSQDLIDAFDDACENIVRRIRKQKTKLEKRLRPKAFDDELIEPVIPETEFEIIRTKHFAIKPLSVQEAILQMEMIGHQFYMFRNEETDQISVVYKRNDGRYGIIEPD